MPTRTTRILVVAVLGAAGLSSIAASSPECDRVGATVVHEVHEAAGPAGEPLHEVEDAYCAAPLLP